MPSWTGQLPTRLRIRPPQRIDLVSFASELIALGKRRIALPDLRAAYLRANPEALGAPDLRNLLLDALRNLENEGTIELPRRGWDKSGSPALPSTVKLGGGIYTRSVRLSQAWLPALAFAADERHPIRRADLEAINTFLLSIRGKDLTMVPTRERSLQIFGNEKRLDGLRKGKHSLFEGQVSLADLHCYPVAPPLPYEAPPQRLSGRPILVLENYHSYDSFCRWNREAGVYAAIAYGAGDAFRQGAGNLDDIDSATAADGAVYVGDIDPAGIKILIGANQRRRAEGRTTLRPHRGLYRWLLAHGRRRPLETAFADIIAAELASTFSPEIAAGLVDLWTSGQRIPQESFGLEQLSSNEKAVALPEAA